MPNDVRNLERQARRLLHPDVYDFMAAGAGQERTLRANRKAWRDVTLFPWVLRDVSAVDTSVTLAGARLATPVGVAPTAAHCLAHPDGEVATATGAAQAGALYIMSTRSSRRIEDIAAATAAAGGTWWFQVYVLRDRQLTVDLVRRAVAAGAAALVLTGDTPVVGDKPRVREGTTVDGAAFGGNLDPALDPLATTQATDVTMADIGWLAGIGGGLPVFVKGVLRPSDAVACVRHGAAGVIVSNHGGRQFDGAPATARAPPAVVAALRAESGPAGTPPPEVYVDGGVRSGADVLAALALGAQAVFAGRPVFWALATGGAPGVESLLTGLTASLSHVMALAGSTSVTALPALSAL